MRSLFESPKAKRRVLPHDPKENRRSQGRAPPAEIEGDRQHLRDPLRAQARRPDGGQGRARRMRDPPQARQALPALPRDPRRPTLEMPFAASFRHEYWTSDVRYVSHSIPETGQAYVVAVLENYSRAILASAVTLSQDTNAYLSVLHAAIGRYGSPGTIVTDGGGIFRSDRAKAVYARWA